MTTSYALLDQAEEDALHKSRLLNVEERPFKRITKRLLTPNSLIATPPTLPPTPPPDGNALDEAAAAHEAEKQQQVEEHRQWREDVLLDFAAFESSIVRIQFLLTSNIKERERYAAEKLTIEATAQAVRENTAELRLQLEEAQRTLATRKEYDELAEKITNNRLLRPREDQHANLQKLGAEIAELERESQDYANTWAERRDQFGRIIEEGMQLRRLIRDEKEEVERREGMEERDDGDDGDAGFQPDHMSGQATPIHGDGGSTPSHVNQDRDRDRSRGRSPAGGGRLLVERHATPGGKSPLRHARGVDEDDSPEGEVRVEEDEEREEEDTDMAEDGELSGEGEPIAMPSEGLVAAPDATETNGRTPATDHMDVS